MIVDVIGDKDTPNDQKIGYHGYMSILILWIYQRFIDEYFDTKY